MIWILLAALALHLVVWFALGVVYRRHSGLVPMLTRGPRARLHEAPPVCICVPARNEEDFIGEAVRSLLAQDYPHFRVVVVNDHSTDATGDILARIKTEDAAGRLTVVDAPALPDGWMGKCHALHCAVQRAPKDTELYLFCDADVIHEPATLRRAVYDMQRDNADLLGLSPRLDCLGFWENAILPLLIHLGVCKLNPKHFNDPSKNDAIAIGAFGLIRRSIYEKWGGHEAIKGEVIDDLAMGAMTKRAGGRLAFVRDPRAIHLRMYSNFDQIVAGFMKNMHTAVGGSVLRMAGFAAALAVTHLAPLAVLLAAVAMGFSGGGAVPLAAVATWLATGLALTRRMGIQCSMNPMQVALGFPLGVLGIVYIMARSSYMGAFEGVVEWRGRKLRQPEQRVQIF